MHALIIEDDWLIAATIEDLLRDLGFTSIDIAATEEDAVRLAAEHHPALITSDVQLFAGTGVAAVAAILRAQAVPVLFVTSVPDEARAHHPTCPVIAKPFSPPALQRALAAECRVV